MTQLSIPFLDLRLGHDREVIDAAIQRVLDRGTFILGPEVESFEAEFAFTSGTSHAVAVNSGTDALMFLLRAAGISAGDEVLTTALGPALRAHLLALGIGTLVHYPSPVPKQPAFLASNSSAWPNAERYFREVVSLPLHPHLSRDQVRQGCSAVNSFVRTEA